MKIRQGFVSNSSACSFNISNTTKETKSIEDFAKENVNLLHRFNKEYEYDFTEEAFLQSARDENITFKPHETKFCIFGDESGTVIGHVFDYMLREGGASESFSWRFDAWRR